MIFLITYDRRAGRLRSLRTFDEAERPSANDARLEAEPEQISKGGGLEVGLVDAPDESVLRKTHSHYFSDPLSRSVESSTESSGVGD